MSKEMDPKVNYRKEIHELIDKIDSRWLLWQIYRTIKNVMN